MARRAATDHPGLAQVVSARKFPDLIWRDAAERRFLMSLERQEFQERPADHPLGGNGERAGSLVNYEPISEDQADCCPYCRRPLEILFVKFRIRGTVIIASCANCGIAHADEWRAAESKALDKAKKLARNSWS